MNNQKVKRLLYIILCFRGDEVKMRKYWKYTLAILMLVGITLTVGAQSLPPGTQFSWIFPPYPLAYFHRHRSVDIFINADMINNLSCSVMFFDENPVYIVKHPRSDVVKPNTWYTSNSYIGLVQVRGKPGLAVKFDYMITWGGPEQTKGWEKRPPDYWEIVKVKGEDQQSEERIATGGITATKGEYQRILNFKANTNDPYILVIRNLDWEPMGVKFPAGANPEQDFRVNGKSTFILVFYPNLHANRLIFSDLPTHLEWQDAFEYIIKRIPQNNP